MKISAFTYVRNGIRMGYPFVESIRSILEMVDEYIVVLGDSDDGTREALLGLAAPHLMIIDTVWDMKLKGNGRIFAQQSNIGLAHVTGDWVIHLQADEVLHEADVLRLKEAMLHYHNDAKTEGLLFPFLNFRGDFEHIHTGRKAHRFEIRAFKKNALIRSYRDSQGFRKYTTPAGQDQGEKGTKLRVAKIDVAVYHYNSVRPPKLEKEKAQVFSGFYHDEQWVEEKFRNVEEVDYNDIDKLEVFTGTHPCVMEAFIRKKDWDFVYDPSRTNSSLRHRILNKIEEWTGYRIGEYKNYKLIR